MIDGNFKFFCMIFYKGFMDVLPKGASNPPLPACSVQEQAGGGGEAKWLNGPLHNS